MMLKKKRKKSRRRSNGVPVLFANPRRRRKRRHTKRRRARARRSNPIRRRRRRANRSMVAKHYHTGATAYAAGIGKRRSSSRKRRRRGRLVGHALTGASFGKGKKRRKLKGPFFHRRHRGRPSRIKKVYTRANPFRVKGWLKLLRTGVFGGLGIVVARVGKNLYTRYLSGYVIGDGSSSLRVMASEALGLVSMAAITLGADKALKKVPGVKHDDCIAFKFGGLAETGRHTVAAVIKRVKPDLALSRYGLDGMGALENADSFMGELESGDSFMGDLEDADSFADA